MNKLKSLTLVWIGCLTICSFAIGDIETNGFISQGFIYSKQNNYLTNSKGGSFEFNETAINFRSRISHRLSVGLQLLSRDLGDQGNNQIKLDWGFADYEINRRMGVRLGKFKSPPGFYNILRDVDLLRTEIFLPQSIYDESTRDFFNSMSGIDLYYNDYTDKGSYKIELLSGVSSFDENSAYLRNMITDLSNSGLTLSEQSMNIYSDNGFSFEYSLPNTDLSFKYSWYKIDGQVNANVDGSNYYASVQAYTTALVNSGTITAAQKAAMDAQALADKNNLENGVQSFDVDVDRWYVYGIEYRKDRIVFAHERKKMDAYLDIPVINITESVLDLGYYTKLDYHMDEKVSMFLYSSVYYESEKQRENNNFDPYHRGFQKDRCLGVRYNIDDSTAAKLEFHDVKGTAQVYTYLNDSLTKDWSYIALKVTVSF